MLAGHSTGSKIGAIAAATQNCITMSVFWRDTHTAFMECPIILMVAKKRMRYILKENCKPFSPERQTEIEDFYAQMAADLAEING